MTSREKDAVRYKTRQAIRRGELARGSKCERCGAEDRVQMHHPDYSQHLLIEWKKPDLPYGEPGATSYDADHATDCAMIPASAMPREKARPDGGIKCLNI